jgi:hypothetical protein
MGDSYEKSHINTTIEKSLHKALKVLAAQQSTRINSLLEEAIRDILVKYEVKFPDPNNQEKNR